MHLITKRIICLALTGALCLSFASCSESNKTGKYAWIDSDLIDNQDLSGSCRLQDDFAASANSDWIMNHTYDPLGPNGSFEDTKLTVDQQKRALLDDASKTSKNLELIRSYDSLFSDWDYRDQTGVEPLRKYIGYIDDISTLEDAGKYMLDNVKNPFAVSLVKLSAAKHQGEDQYKCLEINQPDYSLGKASEYYSIRDKGLQERDRTTATVNCLMTKLGYSREDSRRLLNECFAFETKLADINPEGMSLDAYNLIVTRDQVLEASGGYPLNDMLEHYCLGKAVAYNADLIYLKGLDSVFTAKNLEGIKAYFKVRLMMNSLPLLDEESFTLYRENMVDRMNPFGSVSEGRPDRYLFHILGNSCLNAAMDQAYLDEYYDENVFQDLTDLSNMLIDGYREILDSKDWISDENKARLNEKLDNMALLIINPSNTADFGNMSFVSKEDGGSLLDAYCKINEFEIRHLGDITTMRFDRTYWDIYDVTISTTATGSAYAPWLNVLYIHIGILSGNIYSPDMTIEQKLGAIGAVIGHEMTHAFDSNGVNYDFYGNKKAVIEGNDMETFSSLSSKVTSYYEGITPFKGADTYAIDNILSGEAIADMGSVKCALMIAKDIEGFDYDLFFRSYATLWRSMCPKGDVIWYMREDDHPLHYLRINVTLQQFDEFYITYNIQPGDNMYLAPEDRIAIW
ncbi:MAG: M13 family metallopeptidase [Saccharofermentans sp.]|nr:M13 family metallopeptidase [Saccharofermentans sp.]